MTSVLQNQPIRAAINTLIAILLTKSNTEFKNSTERACSLKIKKDKFSKLFLLVCRYS